MNKIGLSLIALFFLFSCGNEASNSTTSIDTVVDKNMIQGETPGKIVFEKDFHNFGKLEAGEIVTYTFKFKNEGKSSLLVKQVKPSCGCTAPTYTKKPIPPGGTGEVQLGFDSNGFKGLQNKSATVITNGEPSDVVLHFSAEVQ